MIFALVQKGGTDFLYFEHGPSLPWKSLAVVCSQAQVNLRNGTHPLPSLNLLPTSCLQCKIGQIFFNKSSS